MGDGYLRRRWDLSICHLHAGEFFFFFSFFSFGCGVGRTFVTYVPKDDFLPSDFSRVGKVAISTTLVQASSGLL